MSQNNGNTMVAILAGVALGAAAGILFAPDKGSKTRAKIKDGIDEAKNKAMDKFNETKNKFEGKYADTKHNVEDSYEELLSQLSHKAEDAITFLEQKLAELKAQNAKFQK
ncbi:YtxH domain-containing protein [Flavobacterium sp.]|uniref:YtxH domain-containing protein n=1 Tax=Flavobacterium sp. TaxID=239 RepID=UPI0039E49D87